MRRFILTLLLFAITSVGDCDEGLNSYVTETNEIYRTGKGSAEGAFTAISTSMLGWGIGLAVVIGVLVSVLNQSAAGHSHTTTDSD